MMSTLVYLQTDWAFSLGALPSTPSRVNRTELVLVNGSTHVVRFFYSGDVALPAAQVDTASGTEVYEIKSWGCEGRLT